MLLLEKHNGGFYGAWFVKCNLLIVVLVKGQIIECVVLEINSQYCLDIEELHCLKWINFSYICLKIYGLVFNIIVVVIIIIIIIIFREV